MVRIRQSSVYLGDQLPLDIIPDPGWKRIDRLPDLRQCTDIAIDTENKDVGLMNSKGPGWANPEKERRGFICGISVAWRDNELHSHYLPLCQPDSDCFGHDQLKRWLKDHAHAGVRFNFHNAPYDVGWLATELELKPDYKINDTGCMAYMCDENQFSYSLNAIAKWRGIKGKDESILYDAAAWYHVHPKAELYKLPARFVGHYAEQDALATLLLAENLRKQMEAEQTIEAYQLEMNLVPMVYEMRRKGVRIDMLAAERAYNKFKKQSKAALDDLTDKLSMKVGMDEIRSTAWLEKVFDRYKIFYPQTKITKKGSFESKWMKELEHWLPRLIVRAKQREEAAEKFIKLYLQEYVDKNNRLHPSIHQFKSENHFGDEGKAGGTRTYRFSYSDPPLQQIPHRNAELAEEIRGCFIPEKHQLWAKADYSQQEYRLIVHFAESVGMTKASEAAQKYRDDPDTDFHQMVADMTGLDRKPAKDCNFAKAYGAGIKKFAMMIRKSEDEAARIMRQYDERMPFVKELFDYCSSLAETRGYIKLLDGARIRFDWWFCGYRQHGVQWNKEDNTALCRYQEAVRRVQDKNHPWYGMTPRRAGGNKGLNSLIQGGAARQTKLAMWYCFKAGLIPLVQVHDELCFSVPNKKMGERIVEIMRDAVKLNVPMKVDITYGISWAGN